LEKRAVQITTGAVSITGDLVLPIRCRGMILFAHGSGSGRFSPRNRLVAAALQETGWATLLIDLLSEQEEALDMEGGAVRFNLGLLAERLEHAICWLRSEPLTQSLPIGLFGASTGAGAALVAAASLPLLVRAVVSRGGRPELAHEALSKVRAPTLLIVGGKDHAVLELNQEALISLPAVKQLEVVQGASHLFEEPGALDSVARLAENWFRRHLR
jgi:dienelactone hydrolase